MTATGRGITDNTSVQNHRPLSVSHYQVIRCMLSLYLRLRKQERDLKNYLPGLLNGIATGNEQIFSPAQLKRTTKYCQLALNLICANFYQLTGRRLNREEHKRIILLSVLGPLFDDLLDDRMLTHEQITLLVTHPEEYAPVNTTDLLVKKLYLELWPGIPHKQPFTAHLQEVVHWQQESLKQLNDRITEDELYKITYNKSYYGLLLFYAALDHYPDEEILKILYPVAGLMQLTNDIFDVWKDVHNGVYTLPNLYRNFEALQVQFMVEVAEINYQLGQLPYPTKNKRTYAITIHSLNAMGWIALKQLKIVTKGVTSIAALRALSRKTLVCDMDSMQQKMKWLGQIRRLVKFSNKH